MVEKQLKKMSPDSGITKDCSFKGKKVLVAGGTGMIGIPLVELLVNESAQVKIASLDSRSRAHRKAKFHRADLRLLSECLRACDKADYVFNLLCVKGSPAAVKKNPAQFLETQLQFNTNLMSAAFKKGVSGYMFTSSICVYQPAELLKEDDVWTTFPSENDWFGGWAKRMGELQAQAYQMQYGANTSIVRPANVYGPFDNFDPINSMVVPSLIRRVLNGENPLVVWGSPSTERDFIFSEDVARGILLVARRGYSQPVNLGSGVAVSIAELVDVILKVTRKNLKVKWDSSKVVGDSRRVMEISRARNLGFEPQVSLEDGIKKTVEWYLSHSGENDERFDIFHQN